MKRMKSMQSELFALLALLTLFGGPLAGQECHDSGDIPDDAWAPTAITLDDARGFVPRRLLVMRAFWQSGPEAVLIASFERPSSYTITVVSREPYSKKLGARIRALSPSIRDVTPPESVRLNE